MSLYLVMAPLAGAFGGLLASAILKLSHFGGLKSWRMIFAIEGIITIGLALIAFFTLTDRPETAPWLNEQEKELAVARIKSERIATTEVIDKFDRTKIYRGMFSPVTLATSIVFMLNSITVMGMSFFLPTIIASIYPKSPVISQQLHTVPPYIVGAVFTVLIPYFSWKTDKRAVFLLFATPTMAAGFAIFLATKDPQARFAATFLIASSAFCNGPLTNAQVSANVVSDSARSVAIGTNVMFGNVGGLISTWSFLPWDKPDYKIGNSLNLGAVVGIALVSSVLLWWMHADNRRRDRIQEEEYKKIEGLTLEEIQDLDWKHPGFRWKP
jgi:sugar phosphate permease